MGVKVATCCYCGARTALVLRGQERHELSCAKCGAPLHEMKMMPVKSEPVKTAPKSQIRKAKPVKVKKKKRKKSAYRKFFEEVVDVVEDIFD